MPGLLITFIEFNEIDYLYVGLRIFNVVSFLLLFTYFSKIQDQNFINNFHKSMQIILLFLSSITIYIFVAQLFDLPEQFVTEQILVFFQIQNNLLFGYPNLTGLWELSESHHLLLPFCFH